MSVRYGIRCLLAAVWLLFPAASYANDTELTYGGTPRPMSGTGTVTMKSEYVKVVVGEENVVVDCRFTFQNTGPACRVRMGFPDEGNQEDMDDQGNPLPPKPNFTSFKSWVNGKLVKTDVIRGAEFGQVWHVKRVAFPARAILRVRNLYTAPVGSSVGFPKMAAHLAKYVLHTGSSWRGPLGRSEVEIEFKRKSVLSPFTVKKLPAINGKGEFAQPINVSKKVVYYEGPGRPVVSGRTLRFVRINWRPTKKDDILLVFDMRRVPGG